MQNNEEFTFSIIKLVFFSLSTVLLIINTIEVIQLVGIWDRTLNINNKQLFNSCFKWELIFRTANCAFSSIAAIITMMLCIMITMSSDFQKYTFKIVIYYLYKIFGAVMFGLCVLSIYYFRFIFFVCSKNSVNTSETYYANNKNNTNNEQEAHSDKNYENYKLFSAGNFLSISICFFLSFYILFLTYRYNVNDYFMRSYKNHNKKNLLMSVFWYFVFKEKNASQLMKEGIAIIEAQQNERNRNII